VKIGGGDVKTGGAGIYITDKVTGKKSCFQTRPAFLRQILKGDGEKDAAGSLWARGGGRRIGLKPLRMGSFLLIEYPWVTPVTGNTKDACSTRYTHMVRRGTE